MSVNQLIDYEKSVDLDLKLDMNGNRIKNVGESVEDRCRSELLGESSTRAFPKSCLYIIMSCYVILHTCCASQNLNPEVRVQNSIGFQNRARVRLEGDECALLK